MEYIRVYQCFCKVVLTEGLHLSSYKRELFLCYGGGIAVCIFVFVKQLCLVSSMYNLVNRCLVGALA